MNLAYMVTVIFVYIMHLSSAKKMVKLVGYPGYLLHYDFNKDSDCRISTVKILSVNPYDDVLPSDTTISSTNILTIHPQTMNKRKLFVMIFGSNIGFYVKLCQSFYLEVKILPSILHGLELNEPRVMNHIEKLGCLNASRIHFLTVLIDIPVSDQNKPSKLVKYSKSISNAFGIFDDLTQILPSNNSHIIHQYFLSLLLHGTKTFKTIDNQKEYVYTFPLSCQHTTTMHRHAIFRRNIDEQLQNMEYFHSLHLYSSILNRKRREMFFSSISALIGTPVETSSYYTSTIDISSTFSSTINLTTTLNFNSQNMKTLSTRTSIVTNQTTIVVLSSNIQNSSIIPTSTFSPNRISTLTSSFKSTLNPNSSVKLSSSSIKLSTSSSMKTMTTGYMTSIVKTPLLNQSLPSSKISYQPSSDSSTVGFYSIKTINSTDSYVLSSTSSINIDSSKAFSKSPLISSVLISTKNVNKTTTQSITSISSSEGVLNSTMNFSMPIFSTFNTVIPMNSTMKLTFAKTSNMISTIQNSISNSSSVTSISITILSASSIMTSVIQSSSVNSIVTSSFMTSSITSTSVKSTVKLFNMSSANPSSSVNSTTNYYRSTPIVNSTVKRPSVPSITSTTTMNTSTKSYSFTSIVNSTMKHLSISSIIPTTAMNTSTKSYSFTSIINSTMKHLSISSIIPTTAMNTSTKSYSFTSIINSTMKHFSTSSITPTSTMNASTKSYSFTSIAGSTVKLSSTSAITPSSTLNSSTNYYSLNSTARFSSTSFITPSTTIHSIKKSYNMSSIIRNSTVVSIIQSSGLNSIVNSTSKPSSMISTIRNSAVKSIIKSYSLTSIVNSTTKHSTMKSVQNSIIPTTNKLTKTSIHLPTSTLFNKNVTHTLSFIPVNTMSFIKSSLTFLLTLNNTRLLITPTSSIQNTILTTFFSKQSRITTTNHSFTTVHKSSTIRQTVLLTSNSIIPSKSSSIWNTFNSTSFHTSLISRLMTTSMVSTTVKSYPISTTTTTTTSVKISSESISLLFSEKISSLSSYQSSLHQTTTNHQLTSTILKSSPSISIVKSTTRLLTSKSTSSLTHQISSSTSIRPSETTSMMKMKTSIMYNATQTKTTSNVISKLSTKSFRFDNSSLFTELYIMSTPFTTGTSAISTSKTMKSSLHTTQISKANTSITTLKYTSNISSRTSTHLKYSTIKASEVVRTTVVVVSNVRNNSSLQFTKLPSSTMMISHSTYFSTIIKSSNKQYVTSSHPVMTSSVITTSLPNHAPIIRKEIIQLFADTGRLFYFQVPSETFFDIEDGDTRHLSLDAYTGTGDSLDQNTWLIFNSTQQAFTGIPLVNDFQSQGSKGVTIRLVATDSLNNFVIDDFVIIIMEPMKSLSFTISLTLTLDFNTFLTRKTLRSDLLKQISQFYKSNSTSDLYIESIVEGSTIVTWSNTSIGVVTCQFNEIQQIIDRVQVPHTNTASKEFVMFMSPLFPVIGLKSRLLGPCLTNTTKQPVIQSNSVSYLYYVIPITILGIILLIVLIIILFLWKRRRKENDDFKDGRHFEQGKPVLLPDELELKSYPQYEPAKTYTNELYLHDEIDGQSFDSISSYSSDGYIPPGEAPPGYVMPPMYKPPFDKKGTRI